MIVCTNCGFHNDDDDRFCGGCQEFLEWTGEAVEPAADAVDDEPGEEGHRGLVERVVDSLGGRGHDETAAESGAGAQAGDAAPSGDHGDPAADDLVVAAAARADAAAAEAERVQQVAEERAREQAQRTEEARRAAEEAEGLRRDAEAKAAEEAQEAARLREQLAEARRTREAAEAELEAENRQAEEHRERAQQRREQAEREHADAASLAEEEAARTQQATRDREATEARLREEQAALAAFQAELDEAEQARQEAQERAAAEAEAAREASEAAAKAEQERREAEAKAAEQAEAAERARRAAALVARPRPSTPKATPSPQAGAPDDTTGAGVKPTAAPPAAGRGFRRRPRRQEAAEAAAAAAAASAETSDAPPATAPTGPVKPGRTQIRQPSRTQQEPTKRLRPGDRVCGQCGEGNDPDRKFCRRCGGSLAESVVFKQPWYKRMLPRRSPKVVPAGTRPGRSSSTGAKARGAKRKVKGGISSTMRLVAMITIAAAALGIAVVPSLRSSATDRVQGLFTSARRIVAPSYEALVPTGATASSSLDGHPALEAINDTSDQWWAEAAAGDGEGERLIVEFAEPVDVAVVGVTPGAAGDQFVAQPRPRHLHLVFDTGVTADLELEDEHVFQTFDIDGASGVTSVEVQITEVWPGQSGSDLGITTLQFERFQ